jgi:dihydropteroate synthase
MSKTYFRPLGLCYGSDAEQLIASRRAGRLGGSRTIAFTLVERIRRDGKSIDREIFPYTEALQAIEAPRGDFAGLTMDAPRVMGIVNVTPDSFSDGGQHSSSDAGFSHGLAIAAEGAHILDVGGESTRPGSNAVSMDEELSRVVPVVKSLNEAGHVVSIDTRKTVVMREAVKAGAAIVNDVSALQHDPDSLRVVAELNPHYDDVALDVYDQLEQRVMACVQAGIPRSRVAIDPGIGFGKTFRHNLELLNQLTLFHGLGVVTLVGLSRKGFIGALTGEKNAGNRVHGSVGGAVQAALNGVNILRVHDVKATVEALAVAGAAIDPRTSEF